MFDDILIYGANGYSAGLIIELARTQRARPSLAGRSADKLAQLATATNLPTRAFALDDAAEIRRQLKGVRVVLNCAGPFARTARPLAAACIDAGTHYLDITGEIEVFEALAALGGKAKAASVMLMPGTGFDVVPSDCLAAHLKRRLPDATQLTLAFQALGRASRGTATTMIENLHRGGAIRRNGKLIAVPAAYASRDIDFGLGPVGTLCIPWGDVSTAWVSTGIPDIQVFMAAPWQLRVMSRLSRRFGPLLASAPVQRYFKRRIQAGPPGPDPASRRRGLARLWGEAKNASGKSCTSRIDTVEGYTLTALTAWDIAKRVAGGATLPGFCTPSMLFGPDYILGFPGTTRTDVS